MLSIFSRIIAGEIPCHKVAESDHCIAFLDINPLMPGHTLVVPKKEVDDLFDLDSKTYNELMNFSKQVAQALKKSISCKRVTVTVLGFEVPHAHIHLIPVNNESEANFRNPKLKISKEEFEQIAANIAQSFAALS